MCEADFTRDRVRCGMGLARSGGERAHFRPSKRRQLSALVEPWLNEITRHHLGAMSRGRLLLRYIHDQLFIRRWPEVVGGDMGFGR